MGVKSEHVFQRFSLPSIQRDPFDRLLISQALSESMLLPTMDALVAQYPEPVRRF